MTAGYLGRARGQGAGRPRGGTVHKGGAGPRLPAGAPPPSPRGGSSGSATARRSTGCAPSPSSLSCSSTPASRGPGAASSASTSSSCSPASSSPACCSRSASAPAASRCCGSTSGASCACSPRSSRCRSPAPSTPRSGSTTARRSAAVHDLFAAVTYRMNWVEALHHQPPFGLLDHTWSLSIEEQFYLLWPLGLLLAYRIGRGRGVLVAAVAGAAVSAVAAGDAVAHRLPGAPRLLRPRHPRRRSAARLRPRRGHPLPTASDPRRAIGAPAGRLAGPVALALLAVAASRTALFSKGLPLGLSR